MKVDVNIERIIEALSCLHIDNLNKNIYNFINTNFNYFYLENQYTYTSKENDFEIYGDDNSSFRIIISPNYLNIKQVIVELVNLNGMLTQRYNISLNGEETDVVYTKQFITNDNENNKKISKLYIDTKYLNNKIKSEKKIETVLKENSDDNYTKETVTLFTHDDSYIKTEMNINLLNSNIKYYKGNNKSCKNITVSEYEYLKSEKYDIKVKTKKCG